MKKKNVLLIVLITTALLFFVPPVSGATTTTVTYTESYTTDSNNTDPSETWYTYSDSGLNYSNASHLDGYGSDDHGFRMNTTEGFDTTGGALYDFTTETTYDTFSLKFKIDDASHNYTLVTVGTWAVIGAWEGNGAIAYWQITDTKVNFSVVSAMDGNLTTEVWTHAIENDTWYTLDTTFNYNTNIIGCTLSNDTTSSISTGQQASSYNFPNITQSFWAIPAVHGEDSCYIWFDDFILTDSTTTYTDSEITTNNLLDNVIPVLVAVALLLIIVGMIFTMDLTNEALMSIIVLVIIAVIILTVVMSV